MKDIYIVGASGFASEVTEYIGSMDVYSVAGYFDLNEEDYSRYGFSSPFLGNEDEYQGISGKSIVIAISDYALRKKIYDKLIKKQCAFPNIIHNSSFVSKSASLGEASIICPFVTITSNARIGDNFHANIYSYVAHDCIIGNNVTLAPSVKCNGNVVIEDNVYIGTGAILFQGKNGKPLRIGEGAVIAAGSVVTKSVPAGLTVFGNPAIEFTKENIRRRS